MPYIADGWSLDLRAWPRSTGALCFCAGSMSVRLETLLSDMRSPLAMPLQKLAFRLNPKVVLAVRYPSGLLIGAPMKKS